MVVMVVLAHNMFIYIHGIYGKFLLRQLFTWFNGYFLLTFWI